MASGDSPLSIWQRLAPSLSCPHCTQPMTWVDKGLCCPENHRFDQAKQGYVNLLDHKSTHGDTAEMIAARDRVHHTGLFDRLADRIGQWAKTGVDDGGDVAQHLRPQAEAGVEESRTTAASPAGLLVEAGTGTGFYLDRALQHVAHSVGIGWDISVYAARRTAKANPRMGALVADTWGRVPVLDGAADVVICIFAPRNPAEFARILKPGGIAIIAYPTSQHLHQMRAIAPMLTIPEDKTTTTRNSFATFSQLAVEVVEDQVRLDREGLVDLVMMGPNAFHHSVEEVSSWFGSSDGLSQRLGDAGDDHLPQVEPKAARTRETDSGVTVTSSVEIAVFKKTGDGVNADGLALS